LPFILANVRNDFKILPFGGKKCFLFYFFLENCRWFFAVSLHLLPTVWALRPGGIITTNFHLQNHIQI
jgi:hypothetical protein